MDNGWTPSTPDGGGMVPDSLNGIEDSAFAADDPLGDEAAFPSTWQQLDPSETSHE